MKQLTTNSFIVQIVLLSTLFILYSCQQEKTIPVIDKASPIQAKGSTKISELLADMNMYEFDKPIKAPEFDLPSVHGDSLSINQFRGKVVMINFWATW